jgi:hypothetical protein
MPKPASPNFLEKTTIWLIGFLERRIMPVLTKLLHDKLYKELDVRIDNLKYVLKSRELKSSSEGARRGCWKNPDALCATIGGKSDISIAVEDFKTILSEFKKL